VISFQSKERRNTVLNRRLPRITARDVCPSFRREIIYPLEVPTDLTRVETFSGAACLARLPVMQRAETNIVGGFLVRSKAAPLQERLAPQHLGLFLCLLRPWPT
jgi:hypothetical protein